MKIGLLWIKHEDNKIILAFTSMSAAIAFIEMQNTTDEWKSHWQFHFTTVSPAKAIATSEYGVVIHFPVE